MWKEEARGGGQTVMFASLMALVLRPSRTSCRRRQAVGYQGQSRERRRRKSLISEGPRSTHNDVGLEQLLAAGHDSPSHFRVRLAAVERERERWGLLPQFGSGAGNNGPGRRVYQGLGGPEDGDGGTLVSATRYSWLFWGLCLLLKL